MINGNLDVFLDYGWEHDTVLYYNKFYYYFTGCIEEDKKFHYYSWKMRGTMDKNGICCSYYTYKGKQVELVDDLFVDANEDKDLVKKHFIEAKIFDGKSFLEVEKDIIWAEDGGELKIESLNDIK